MLDQIVYTIPVFQTNCLISDCGVLSDKDHSGSNCFCSDQHYTHKIVLDSNEFLDLPQIEHSLGLVHTTCNLVPHSFLMRESLYIAT